MGADSVAPAHLAKQSAGSIWHGLALRSAVEAADGSGAHLGRARPIDRPGGGGCRPAVQAEPAVLSTKAADGYSDETVESSHHRDQPHASSAAQRSLRSNGAVQHPVTIHGFLRQRV